jgi:hypothetical protein
MSTRDLTTPVENAIDSTVVRPVVLAELSFPSGTVNFWTGQGSITWDSKSWDGTGRAVNFSTFPETTDGSSQGIQIDISGVDSADINDVTQDDFQGTDVYVWIAFLDSSGTVIGNPWVLFSGIMDTGEINDNGQTSTITINAESKLINQIKRIQNRYTDQDQQRLYPGDIGLELIGKIQDKSFVWKS